MRRTKRGAVQPSVQRLVNRTGGSLLVGAVLGLIGLMLSLAGHRRRVWFRALPGSADSNGGTLLTSGGLPRTDYPGFSDEFNALVKAAEEGTS